MLKTTMRLELDLNNPQALREQRDELMRAISVINAALAGAPERNGEGDGQALTSEARLRDLPGRFTIANLIAGGQLSRGSAKNLLTDWLEDQSIRIAERGRAGKATIYEKSG